MTQAREAVLRRGGSTDAAGGRTLVLFDADVASVLALAYAVEDASLASVRAATHTSGRGGAGHLGQDQPPPLVMPAYAGMTEARARADATARALDVLGVQRLGTDVGDAPGLAIESGEAQTRLLVGAAYQALAAGCRTIIWPIQHGEDLRASEPTVERVARAIDRAMLVSRLASLDMDHDGLEIQTPMVDLSDRQIAELVMDIEAPLACCWWWGGTTPDALASQDRWGALLRTLGWGGALGPG